MWIRSYGDLDHLHLEPFRAERTPKRRVLGVAPLTRVSRAALGPGNTSGSTTYIIARVAGVERASPDGMSDVRWAHGTVPLSVVQSLDIVMVFLD